MAERQSVIQLTAAPPVFWEWFCQFRCSLAIAEEEPNLSQQERMARTLLAVCDFARSVTNIPEYRREFDFLRYQTAYMASALGDAQHGIDHPLTETAMVGNKQQTVAEELQRAHAIAIVRVAKRHGLDHRAAAQRIADALNSNGMRAQGNAPISGSMILEWVDWSRRKKAKGKLPEIVDDIVSRLDRDGFSASDAALTEAISSFYRPRGLGS